MQEERAHIDDTKIKLLVVDDHKLVSNLLLKHLVTRDYIGTVELANGCKDALSFIKTHDIDICILDIVLPDGNGLDLAKDMLKIKPKTKVIFLSASNTKMVIVEAANIGASFISKSSDINEIFEAINYSLRDERYFCQDSLKILIGSREEAKAREFSIASNTNLTEREREILQLILDEQSIVQMADKLYLSPRTVQTHKKNIMAKLGASSTVALIKMIYEDNLLDEPPEGRI